MNNSPAGVSEAVRYNTYERAAISPENIAAIEAMVIGSESRRVGKGALRNVIVGLQSKKNGGRRFVESHTCELIFAYERELDPGVVGYYVQVPCPHMVRSRQHGRHVSSATLDFLVFGHDRVILVECKTVDWLTASVSRPKSEWLRVADGKWTNAVYNAYADERQLLFKVWAPPHPPGIYLQNLEACYVALGTPCPDLGAARHVLRLLEKAPQSLDDLATVVPGFTQELARWLLAQAQAFGPMRAISMARTGTFRLYLDAEQARRADEVALRLIQGAISQPEISDPICLASTADLRRAQDRLARLQRMMRGDEPWTRRFRELDRDVKKCVEEGRSAIAACLTNFKNSGNRTPRLSPVHYQLGEKALSEGWDRGELRRPIDLVFRYEKLCESQGVVPAGRWRLDKDRTKRSASKHALATGGMRGYQAIREATDPTYRSQTPIGFGYVLHIDSSDFDLRLKVSIDGEELEIKAKVYVAVDDSSGLPLAHALIFGPARTDGLALLFRDLVRRHGWLPPLVHWDRASENKSHWIDDFCARRTSTRLSPTAGSPWNGIAENLIKQINDQLAHRLPGSTLPDRAGRKVDGRFKSYTTAKLRVETIHELIEHFLYDDVANRLGKDGETPKQRRDRLLADFGSFGMPCAFDESFRYETSLVVEKGKKVDKRRGIRTEEGWFTSQELKDHLRLFPVDEVRSDCESPELLHVRIAGKVIRAFHSRVLALADLEPRKKLIELQLAPLRRAASRRQGHDAGKRRFARLQLASMAEYPAATTSTACSTAMASTAPGGARVLPQSEEGGAERAPSPCAEWRDLDQFPETD